MAVSQIGNGSLNLSLTKTGKFFTVYGGPYMRRPANLLGVKLAKEIDLPFNVECRIPDFSVPTTREMDQALTGAIDCILTGKPVYFGCMGGQGRTGLMLAILAKAFGVVGPVQYVRLNYYRHAVETREQEWFVEDYIVPPELLHKLHIARKLASFVPGQKLTAFPNSRRKLRSVLYSWAVASVYLISAKPLTNGMVVLD